MIWLVKAFRNMNITRSYARLALSYSKDAQKVFEKLRFGYVNKQGCN